MKIYNVARTRVDNRVLCFAYRDEIHGPRPVAHCILHSPSGLETGYAGSGPADLAVSILADYLDADPRKVEKLWRGRIDLPDESAEARAIRLHQRFKFEFITPRQLEPGRSYEILGAEISHWIGHLELDEKRSAEVAS